MRYVKEMQKILIPELLVERRDSVKELIRKEEAEYQNKILEVCDEILRTGKNMILLTGPSGSGKTTTAMKIAEELKNRGKKMHRISLDDFYKDNENQPLWSDGSKNYETVESLDVDYFNDRVKTLLGTGKADFPVFDFTSGNRSKEIIPLTYDEETYLIFEGIHALNPLLDDYLDSERIMRIYVSVHSDFLDSEGNVIIKARNLRLMRRMLRDSVHRDADALETLGLWQYVLRGEKLYIKPFRKNADIHINSTHSYEPFLYRDGIYKLLAPIQEDERHGELVKILLAGLSGFEQISKEMIPSSSLIQEFI